MIENLKFFLVNYVDLTIFSPLFIKSLSKYIFYFFSLAICSTLIFWTLLCLRQFWIKSLAQTLTLYMLPFITAVLTEVISGDIALSLGMIGALSIVRFRNPIRSPFELTVYFLSITLGITVRHDATLLFFLIGSFCFLSFIYLMIEKLVKNNFGRSFFLPSFREGNLVNTIEIVTSADLPSNFSLLEPNNIIKNEDGYTFLFTSLDRNRIKDTYNFFKNHKIVKSINVNYI